MNYKNNLNNGNNYNKIVNLGKVLIILLDLENYY
jgi:hypothetical protein